MRNLPVRTTVSGRGAALNSLAHHLPQYSSILDAPGFEDSWRGHLYCIRVVTTIRSR